jgi:hypothetical protein
MFRFVYPRQAGRNKVLGWSAILEDNARKPKHLNLPYTRIPRFMLDALH